MLDLVKSDVLKSSQGALGMTTKAAENKSVTEPKKILVVEDEDTIRDLIALHLKREGHLVDAVSSVEDAHKLLETKSYDLLALDWMLPGVNGVEFAKRLRAAWAAAGKSDSVDPAILMVTARAEATDIVEGLEAGADDYVTKPFEPSVLLARVRALLRRGRASKNAEGDINPAEVRLGGLSMNTDTYDVKCDGEPLQLTPSEFKLLLALAQSKGRVLTRDSLISQVQGDGVSVVGRTVDTHVFGLRKKLGSCADLIETVRGVGYRVKTDI